LNKASRQENPLVDPNAFTAKTLNYEEQLAKEPNCRMNATQNRKHPALAP